MKHNAIAGLLLGAVWTLAGCTTASGPPAPVPPPMAETIPKPPVSATPLIWQPGHWDWTGSSYVWVSGQYVETAGHSGSWMPGFWENTGSAWIWRPAHWL